MSGSESNENVSTKDLSNATAAYMMKKTHTNTPEQRIYERNYKEIELPFPVGKKNCSRGGIINRASTTSELKNSSLLL